MWTLLCHFATHWLTRQLGERIVQTLKRCGESSSLQSKKVSLEKIPGHYFSSFLKVELMSWQQNNGYIAAHNFVRIQNIANDTSEHALGLLTAFNTGKVRSRRQQEYLRSIVSVLWQTLWNCFILLQIKQPQQSKTLFCSTLWFMRKPSLGINEIRQLKEKIRMQLVESLLHLLKSVLIQQHQPDINVDMMVHPFPYCFSTHNGLYDAT